MGKRWGRRRAGARLALVLGLLAHTLAAVPARAEPADAALQQKVEALLAAGAEPSAQRAVITAMGEPGEQALMRVFERAEAPRYVRLRALSVLHSFHTATAARYFEDLVRAAGTPDEARLGALHPARSPLVLRRALEGLLETESAATPKIEPAPVTACLANEDPHVRKLAARVLATLEGAEVDQALGARLVRERSAMVRGTIQAGITSRSARRVAPR